MTIQRAAQNALDVQDVLERVQKETGMTNHAFVNSDRTKFDSNCAVCDGKQRDSVHGPTDTERERLAACKEIAAS